MARIHRLLAALVLTSAACGSPAAEQPTPAAPTTTATAAEVDGTAPGTSVVAAAPTGSWSLLDVVPQDAVFVARLDGKTLRAAPIYQALITALRAKGGGELLDKAKQQCGFSVEDSVDELVVSGSLSSEADVLLVARVTASGDAALKCIGQLSQGNAAPGNVGGRPGIKLPGQRVVVTTDAPGGPVLVAGREEMVQAAVQWIAAKKRGSSSLLGRLDRNPPVFLSAFATPPEQVGARAVKISIEADAAHLSAKVVVETPSPEQGDQLVGMAQQGLKQAVVELDALEVPADTKKQLKGYLSGIRVKGDGASVVLEFGVKGDVAQQALFVGTMASLAEASVQRYLVRSKSAEARSTVGAIARGLAAYMEREEVGPGGKATRPKRFPPSAPRTPAKVPKGVAERVTDKTWSHATWRAIKFSMEQPIRYSYEIITSGDGKTATVRATGDLDGDGKFSTFERKVTLGKDGTVSLSPQVDVKDELE